MLEQANRRPIASALSGWADHGHGNLSQRLARGLRRLIDAGILTAGSPLPPERRLAEELAVSRSTVSAALDVLRADGVVTSRQGRGTFVVGFDSAAGEDIGTNRMAVHLVEGAGGIDLAVGNPADVSHLPPVSIDIADLLASGAGPGFQPLGLPLLRVAIAELHTATGLHTDAEEVHVTAGAHQAISLAITALAGRREPVAAQTPGYPGFFDILEGIGHPVAALRADRAGILPESLSKVLGDGTTSLVYIQAGPQNPTGVVTSPARLRALAAVLDEHDATVIEDSTLAELVFAGRPPTDLARLCRRATVVSVGSFSKVLWGGLRVGWMRGSVPVIDRTLHRRLALDLGASTPSQLLTLGLVPHLPEIAAARRVFLASSVQRGVELLRAEVPEWDVPIPDGGSALWPDTRLADTEGLVQIAHRHGVHLAPGSIAVEGRRPDPHLRICVDRPWPLVEAGLRRVGAAWRDLSRQRSRIAG
ncbi:MAG: PLP-dependent aminotransferase family protein [Ilumatobacteraceae bacterium]